MVHALKSEVSKFFSLKDSLAIFESQQTTPEVSKFILCYFNQHESEVSKYPAPQLSAIEVSKSFPTSYNFAAF